MTKKGVIKMNYMEKLKHYLDDGYYETSEDVKKEAIAVLEDYFGLISEEELINHSRVIAIAYLALKGYDPCTDK